jgi:hypothetical protein
MANPRSQIPLKFEFLGRDGKVTQPWAFFLQTLDNALPPPGPSNYGYVIDGTASTTGPTTIFQGAASARGSSPTANSVYIADDTGQVFTVNGNQWQEQTPALTGDVLKDAFSDVTRLAVVNTAPGVFGSATQIPIVTVNNKGLVTNIELVDVQTNLNLPGKVGTFPYKGNTVGDAAANNLFNVNTFTVTYKFAFHQADASPLLMCSIPANTVVTGVELVILTAFDGTNPTVSIGVGPSFNDLLATTDNNPKVLSNWNVEPSVRYVSAEDIYVKIVAGGGSAGYAMVNISTVQL